MNDRVLLGGKINSLAHNDARRTAVEDRLLTRTFDD